MAYTTIDDAGSFFNPILYTGTGSSNAITGVGFQPDMTWIKDRDAVQPHVLFDAVRGANKRLYPNTTAAEGTETQALMSFDSDGFTLGTWGDLNNTDDFVSWNWKAGTTTGLSGSTVTLEAYSINTTSGIGIYQYTDASPTGRVIAHGLGIAPRFLMIKNLGMTTDWACYHRDISPSDLTQSGDYFIRLNTNAARNDNSGYFDDTLTDATNITVGADNPVGGSGQTLICYAFAPIQGYSFFGGYEGNGNADGPFIHTGFQPAFVMLKEAVGGNAGGWFMYDDKRPSSTDGSTYNTNTDYLLADTTAAEAQNYQIDFLSNGFKLRHSGGFVNGSGNDYIFAAFAKFPFVSSNSIPTTAR